MGPDNPVALASFSIALTANPDLTLGAAAMLEGNKLQTLLAEAAQGGKPRLFLLDLWEPYKSYAPRINEAKGRVQYAGRGLFYKRCAGTQLCSCVALKDALTSTFCVCANKMLRW